MRDKYIRLSRQRLGDNPRDYDGNFTDLEEDVQDVAGIRPDAELPVHDKRTKQYKPWKIYPKPPPPHWHWKGKKPASSTSTVEHTEEEFDFNKFDIPGEDHCGFELDDKGVYQVYEDVAG